MEHLDLSPETVAAEHRMGISFKQGIELYDCVETNENFFIGKQWEGVEAGGLPTPVFNFLKRVVLFAVANVCTENWVLNAQPLGASSPVPEVQGGMEALTDILNKEFTAIMEHNSAGKLIRGFTRNAAVRGDGCLYVYWDPEIVTGQASTGGIRIENLKNTQVHFGNPNDPDVQDQPWILIERRRQVAQVRREAKAAGMEDLDAIVADSKSGGDTRMDELSGGKVTVLLRLWRSQETGTIWAYECTSRAELRKAWDLGIRRYPITWMNWDEVDDCCHGQAMITGLIPNQIFVNKLFAMSMISLMTLAYPKIVYDRTKVRQWTNRVGAAIAVGGPVDGVAKVIGPAAVSPQIGQFIDLAVSYTQRFLGATDAALGDTRPDNATAIIALQRAASTPMELTRQNLLQSIEDLGRICMEFMGEYYGVRSVALEERGGISVPLTLDFSVLKDVPCGVKLDVGASTYWSEIASMQTLDNLLLQGKISTVEYLRRLPEGVISHKAELIQAIEGQQAVRGGVDIVPAEAGMTGTGAAPMAPRPANDGSEMGRFMDAMNQGI